MDKAGSGLLAASPLAKNQYRPVGFGQRSRLGTELPHDWTNPDEEPAFADQLDFFAGVVRLDRFTETGEVASDDRCKLTLIHGSYEIVPRAQPNYIVVFPHIAGVANQNNRQPWTEPAQPAQNMQTVGITLRKIEQEQVWPSARLDALHRLPYIPDDFQLPGARLAHGPDCPNKNGVTTDEQQPRRLDRFC